MTLAESIHGAKRAFSAAGLDCGAALLPPADEAAIDAMGAALGLPVPPELRELYRVHGGQSAVGAGVTGLFGLHRLHTPDEVVERHQMFAELCLLDEPPAFPPPASAWGYWVPTLIPFASWDAYDLCIHSESGEVWEFIPNVGLTRHFPSIAAVLRAAIDAGPEADPGGWRLMP